MGRFFTYKNYSPLIQPHFFVNKKIDSIAIRSFISSFDEKKWREIAVALRFLSY